MHIKGTLESEVIFANHLLGVLSVHCEAGPVFDFGCSRNVKTPILLKIKPGVLFTYLLDSVCRALKISLFLLFGVGSSWFSSPLLFLSQK